jgi:glutathione reductase (NADPH)
MNSQHFDTIVLGSGTSAYFVVDTLNRAGKKVAIIDERPYGGTCALRGCQPKKYLVCNAEAVAQASHLVGKGISTPPQTDWKALQALKNEFLNGRSENEVKDWQEAGVSTFHGSAKFTGPNKLMVENNHLSAHHIVLATGATPRRSEFPGNEHIKVSNDFLELPDLPPRIIFIGGGYISFEFAHIAKRAGASEVTIIHRSHRPLKAFDPDVVATVIAAGRNEGIQVRLNETPVEVQSMEPGLRLKTSTGDEYDADLIIEATGRVPNLSVLGQGQGNVASKANGILVNEFLQSTSNPQVYAVGDCAATPYMLAPVADQEGKTAAQNILQGNQHTVDYSVIPSAVFTIPSIGSVGLNEEQAQAKGIDFRVNKGTTTGWPSSKRIGEQHSFYKILINNQTNEILGAHLARHNASEAINILALAMKFHIKAPDLAEFMWAYPTITSDLKYMVK